MKRQFFVPGPTPPHLLLSLPLLVLLLSTVRCSILHPTRRSNSIHSNPTYSLQCSIRPRRGYCVQHLPTYRIITDQCICVFVGGITFERINYHWWCHKHFFSPSISNVFHSPKVFSAVSMVSLQVRHEFQAFDCFAKLV